jgi:acetolactate synthase-1/2/3 large subunit
MNGAESLISTLALAGVDTCFANPGTTEVHIVAALDRLEKIRCVLGLFEGVVTGAADGYARMAGKPACTLLHLGPGFANGLANLHNASRAQVPIVNLIGQHATYHLRHNTPLVSDIEALARPYSKWLRTSGAVGALGRDGAEAVAASRRFLGQIATLIVPADAAWSEGGVIGLIPPFEEAPIPAVETIERVATRLRSGLRTGIVIAGNALFGKGLRAAGRIAAATNSKLLAPYPFTRLERGAGAPVVERIHYIIEQAVEQLREFRELILVGAQAPVAYFAYPGKDSVLTPPECEISVLASAGEDCAGALDALAAALSLPETKPAGEKAERPPAPSGAINLPGLAAAVGSLLPENAIVVDESNTSGRGMLAATRGCPRHDWLVNTGGSIGIALPLAVGAAIACPERPVLCLTADGSAMYTLQALWTMAREKLNVLTVIFANRRYRILDIEMRRTGANGFGPAADTLIDIGNPDLNWVSLASGMGVAATRATSAAEFTAQFREAVQENGPRLIEAVIGA